MEIDEKLSFFMELINCNYNLHYWSYDADFNLLDTDWPSRPLFSTDFFDFVGFRELLLGNLKAGKWEPLILEAESNLLWIAGFRVDAEQPRSIFLIGPVFGGRDTHLIIRRKLDSYDLSVKLRASMHKIFEEIPTVSSNILAQYAVMLHYCLNQENISIFDVLWLNSDQAENAPLNSGFPGRSSGSDLRSGASGRPGDSTLRPGGSGRSSGSDLRSGASRRTGDSTLRPIGSGKAGDSSAGATSHPGIWLNEQQLCKMFADGDPRYKEAVQKSYLLSSGMKADIGDSLRSHKNNCFVLLTLCSRACISGGLSPDISYDLNDYYARKIEECGSITDTRNLCWKMMDDYVSRVREVKQNTSVSNIIRSSCEYIKAHLTEELSIQDLADRTGYSVYYFSHKFKKEMGCTVNDFILREKIGQAKLLLAGTTESIQSISDHLAFSNRSYFYSCFQKLTGMSPTEYRNAGGSENAPTE